MANHPSRSQQSEDAAIKRLLNAHHLDSIEVTFSLRNVHAVARPAPYSPIVAQRRETLIAERGSISLKDASDLLGETMKPVAMANAPTLAEAVLAIRDRLKALA